MRFIVLTKLHNFSECGVGNIAQEHQSQFDDHHLVTYLFPQMFAKIT